MPPRGCSWIHRARDATSRSAWTAFSRSTDHYVLTTFTAADFTLETVNAAGTVIDRFTLNRAAQDNDGAAPTVTIASPASGSILSGTETIDVDADDDTRVEKVDLWVDGQLRSIDLTAPYAFALNTTTLANGTHTIEARAYDIAGNRTAAKRTVTISN